MTTVTNEAQAANGSDPKLAELRGQLEEAQIRAQIKRIESAIKAADLETRFVGRVAEAWGDRVDRTEYLRDGAGISFFGDLSGAAISQASDRRDGDNFPFWQTETELAQIRGVARVLAQIDEVAIGALENLTNYAVGDGFTYKVVAKQAGDPQAAILAKRVQKIVDRCLEENEFTQQGERDFFASSRRDGELIVALAHRGGPSVELIQIDPGALTEPDNVRELGEYARLPDVPLSWKYGIATQRSRTQRPHAYFVDWASDGSQDWDVFGPDRLIHLKLNVDRAIKRGVSDYFAVWRNLERSGRLLGNTLEGASVQAAIAYIREHAQGTSVDSIADLVTARADVRKVDPTTGKTRNVAKMRPGTIVDVTAGLKYQAGPMGSPNGPAFVEIVQAGLRMAGIRWTMPEYMISGDASNANFSSTLVSESPFVKATSSRQGIYVRTYRKILWNAVKLIATRTKLLGAGVTPQVLDELLDLVVDAPEIAVRDRLQEHMIRKEEYSAGILSKATWATEAGRDLATEQQLGAKEKVPPQQIIVSGGGLPPGAMPAAGPQGQRGPGDLEGLPQERVEAARRAVVDEVISQLWEGYP